MSGLAARFDLPTGVIAPGAARHAVASMLYGWGYRDDEWMQAMQLVVSDLVTTAVVHAGGCLSLELHADRNRVTVAAVDRSAVTPRLRQGDDNNGPGVWIIEDLAAGWGVDYHGGGKRIWVELALHPDPIEPPSLCGKNPDAHAQHGLLPSTRRTSRGRNGGPHHVAPPGSNVRSARAWQRPTTGAGGT
jgi:anti-sigma regulatory factor (Ser/Thr protein kinase)